MGMQQLLADIGTLIATINGKQAEIDAAVLAAKTAILDNTKTFWVDPVAGLDTNAGTQAAPFATIKKACDSVPVSGVGTINLAGGVSHVIPFGTIVSLTRKSITFKRYGVGTAVIENRCGQNNTGYNATSNIELIDSSVRFDGGVGVRTAEYTDVGQENSMYSSLFVRAYKHNGSIWFYGPEIMELRDTPMIRCSPGGQLTDVAIYAATITRAGANVANTPLIESSGATIRLISNANILPAGAIWKDDLITGLVFDPDGKPRNLLSNLIL